MALYGVEEDNVFKNYQYSLYCSNGKYRKRQIGKVNAQALDYILGILLVCNNGSTNGRIS